MPGVPQAVPGDGLPPRLNGALGTAALLSGKLDVKGKKVVIVVSGGNIDPEELKELLTKSR